jgi:hypothetical protein
VSAPVSTRRSAASRAAWQAPAALALIALVVRMRPLFVARHLTLDDGAYGVSIVDMRHGMAPYRDLFSSQGPLHYPLLALGDLVGFHARNAPRLIPVLAGVACAITVWAIARRLGSPPAVALTAGALVATTGSLLWVTATVSADGPVAALTLAAIWASLVFRDRPRGAVLLVVGAFLGAALATKPLMFPAILPVACWCFTRRRVFDLFTVGATAAAVWFLAALPWGLRRVWEQSIRFHLDKQDQASKLSQLGKLVSTLAGRDIVLVVAVVLGLIAIYGFHRRVDFGTTADVWIVTAWLALVAVVLVFEKLLLVSHITQLVLPLALLFALRPPPLRWLAVAIVVLVPLQLIQLSDILWPRSYTGRAADVVAQLRALPGGSRAISDIPGLVWQAGLTTPRMLNDNSYARISTRRETLTTVTAGAAEPRTCAVVVWSFRYGENMPGLASALSGLGYDQIRNWGPDQQLWLKRACATRRLGGPSGRARATSAPAR